MEYKKCPCCNGEAKPKGIIAKNGHAYGFVVKCNMCGLQTKIYKTADEAWSAWNTRCKDEKDI